MCGFKLDNNESYNQEQDDAPIIGDNIKIHLVSIWIKWMVEVVK